MDSKKFTVVKVEENHKIGIIINDIFEYQIQYHIRTHNHIRINTALLNFGMDFLPQSRCTVLYLQFAFLRESAKR